MTLERLITSELENIKIPPRPAVLLNIQQEMRKGEPDFLVIEQLISLDVGISASLVKIANSPLFGSGRHVRSVKDALTVLGLNAVASSVAALALRQTFANVPNLQRFWDSSARIAQLSGWLAPRLDLKTYRVKAEEAYTFGLFRDCGIPIMMSVYADYFEILKVANAAADQLFTTVEQTELNIDHAMVGCMLAKEWELPMEFALAVEAHHDPVAIQGLNATSLPDISRYLIAISQFSEFLFQSLTGLNRTSEWQKLGVVCLSILGIQPDDVDAIIAQASAEGIHTLPLI